MSSDSSTSSQPENLYHLLSNSDTVILRVPSPRFIAALLLHKYHPAPSTLEIQLPLPPLLSLSGLTSSGASEGNWGLAPAKMKDRDGREKKTWIFTGIAGFSPIVASMNITQYKTTYTDAEPELTLFSLLNPGSNAQTAASATRKANTMGISTCTPLD